MQAIHVEITCKLDCTTMLLVLQIAATDCEVTALKRPAAACVAKLVYASAP